MANRRGFIEYNPNEVASGLQRMVDQGIATDVGGVPSFNNDSIALFLQLHGEASPQSFPNTTPVEDAPPHQLIDPSLKFSANTQGLMQIDSRLADLAVQKNNVAVRNLDTVAADSDVMAARAQLTDITSTRMFSFGLDPAAEAELDKRMANAQNNLVSAEQRAKSRIQTQTAIDVAPLDNEITRLTAQRGGLTMLIDDADAARSALPVGLQTTISAAERVNITEVDKVWDTLGPGKKALYSETTSLPKGTYFQWADPLIDFDRDGYTSYVRSTMKPGDQAESFENLLPKMNKDLAIAQSTAETELKTALEDPLNPIADDPEAQAAWVSNRTGLIMQDNVTRAWDSYVKGSSPEALPRDRFSSDEMWQAAKELQSLMDPTQQDVSTAVTHALSRARIALGFDTDKRNQLVSEYLRVQQTVFNEPRNPFGMGMDQTTIDVMADTINTRAISIDRIKARASIMGDDLAGMGQAGPGLGPVPEQFPGQSGDVGVARPVTRQQASIASTSQTALDTALSAIGSGVDSLLGIGGGDPKVKAQIERVAASIHTTNPGLTFEEAASMATRQVMQTAGNIGRAGEIFATGASQGLQILAEEAGELTGAAGDKAKSLIKELEKLMKDDDKDHTTVGIRG